MATPVQQFPYIGGPSGYASQGLAASLAGPSFSISPGMVGSALGGLGGRALAGALTGSMFGPVGTLAGLLGNVIGYGLSQGQGEFGTPGFEGQTDPADASAGFGMGGIDGGSDSPGGHASGPGGDPSIGGGEGGGAPGAGSDGSDGDGFARGGKVTRARIKGANPRGPDDGYAALNVGEYVISKPAADLYGLALLEAINSGRIDRGRLLEALLR